MDARVFKMLLSDDQLIPTPRLRLSCQEIVVLLIKPVTYRDVVQGPIAKDDGTERLCNDHHEAIASQILPLLAMLWTGL